MSLQSKLFSGDHKLEAAAVSDPAHIIPGASGAHVAKIQQALNVLDGAAIAQDGKYGRATAAAVLAYKRKRNIVNRSYETQADDIVGKMTIASLDREMFKKENALVAPVQIQPLSYARIRTSRSGLPAIFRNPRLLQRNVSADPQSVGDFPPLILPGNQFLALELPENGVGIIQVINCAGGTVGCLDPIIGRVFDPDAHTGRRIPVVSNSQIFGVRAGLPGRTMILASNRNASRTFLGSHALLNLVVQNPRPPTDYQRCQGVNHDHQPRNRWAEIKANPQNDMDAVGALLAHMCANCLNPEDFMAQCRSAFLSGNPVAINHMDWFLDGKNADFVEDSNILHWLLSDHGIRKKLRFEILRGDPSRKDKPNLWKTKGRFSFDTENYEVDDFRYSFGSIDVVCYELDFGDGSVHVWFKDRYEWHPYYPGIYEVKGGDEQRNTNCLHAAGVECKAGKARDYWMVGEAFVPMSLIIDEVES